MIPGLVQWVKDLALLQAAAWVTEAAQIWCGCGICQRVFCLFSSALTFRSLIHFEFIFVYGVRECSNFLLLHVAVLFSQHHILKGMSFLNCIVLPPLS